MLAGFLFSARDFAAGIIPKINWTRGKTMCGRFTIRTNAGTVKELFGVADVESFELRYNVAPTQTVPVVRSIPDSTSRELAWMRWGLVPRWAKDISIGARSINARAETVEEKPTFRDAFKKRRCLVIADGYYEWITKGKSKQPYFIHFDDHHPFGFAGLWERWQGPTQSVESFTIITTSAVDRMGWLHERMPVIISPDRYDEWLKGAGQSDLLTGYLEADLIAEPVGTGVGNVKNDSPDCIIPIRI